SSSALRRRAISSSASAVRRRQKTTSAAAASATRSKRSHSGGNSARPVPSAPTDIQSLMQCPEHRLDRAIHFRVGQGPLGMTEAEAPGDAALPLRNSLPFVQIEWPHRLQQLSRRFADDLLDRFGREAAVADQRQVTLHRRMLWKRAIADLLRRENLG